MAKFKSKYNEIEAEQFVTETNPLPPGVQYTSVKGYYVTTAQGREVEVNLGEWIAKEPDGSGYYPIKDEIFHKRWESLGESRDEQIAKIRLDYLLTVQDHTEERYEHLRKGGNATSAFELSNAFLCLMKARRDVALGHLGYFFD